MIELGLQDVSDNSDWERIPNFAIIRRLEVENTLITHQSLYHLMQKFWMCGTMRPSKEETVTNEMLQFINLQPQENDELASQHLPYQLLAMPRRG